MFEGFVLENDFIVYCYYVDSWYCFDIYGKMVLELVMDMVSWQYYDIMDWGLDIFKVGNLLGLGSFVIWFQDFLYIFLNCVEKMIEIIENGDQCFIICIIFMGL